MGDLSGLLIDLRRRGVVFEIQLQKVRLRLVEGGDGRLHLAIDERFEAARPMFEGCDFRITPEVAKQSERNSSTEGLRGMDAPAVETNVFEHSRQLNVSQGRVLP